MITNLVVTAYIATSHPCANGNMPRVGITCAAPRNIPLGTKIYIPTIGWRTVEDRTSKKYDGRIDVFMRTKKEAIEFGKQTLEITIYENLHH